MIDCRCPERLEAVKEFARSRGLLEHFEAKLTYLSEYGNLMGDGTVSPEDNPHRKRVKTVLYHDRSPHSFLLDTYWALPGDKEGEYSHHVMAGGLIYYGPGETGVSAPQFSVRIGDTKEGWTVNT